VIWRGRYCGRCGGHREFVLVVHCAPLIECHASEAPATLAQPVVQTIEGGIEYRCVHGRIAFAPVKPLPERSTKTGSHARPRNSMNHPAICSVRGMTNRFLFLECSGGTLHFLRSKFPRFQPVRISFPLQVQVASSIVDACSFFRPISGNSASMETSSASVSMICARRHRFACIDPVAEVHVAHRSYGLNRQGFGKERGDAVGPKNRNYRLQKVSSNSTSVSDARGRWMPSWVVKRMLSAYLLALISGMQAYSPDSPMRSICAMRPAIICW